MKQTKRERIVNIENKEIKIGQDIGIFYKIRK